MTRTSLKLTATAALALFAAASHAERPMAVDDAGTLGKGGFKLEAGWSKDDHERGWEAAAGFAPIDNLEVEIASGRARDHGGSPHLRLQGTAIAAKWVPLQRETGFSAGIKLEFGRTRVDEQGNGRHTSRERALIGLASWSFESGQAAHLNLGREWARYRGESEVLNTWGIGLDQPLGEQLQLTLELFGSEHGRPDRQIGLRWEVAEGLKLSAAIGQGNGRRLANAGVAWEF